MGSVCFVIGFAIDVITRLAIFFSFGTSVGVCVCVECAPCAKKKIKKKKIVLSNKSAQQRSRTNTDPTSHQHA